MQSYKLPNSSERNLEYAATFLTPVSRFLHLAPNGRTLVCGPGMKTLSTLYLIVSVTLLNAHLLHINSPNMLARRATASCLMFARAVK